MQPEYEEIRYRGKLICKLRYDARGWHISIKDHKRHTILLLSPDGQIAVRHRKEEHPIHPDSSFRVNDNITVQ